MSALDRTVLVSAAILVGFAETALGNGQLPPTMPAGALIGRLVVSRLDQGVFEGLVLFLTLAAGVNLLR